MLLHTQVITSETVFTDLFDEWLNLLNRSITNYVFQTPQFQEAWWHSLGEGELRVITVRDEQEKLRGLAPLFIHTNSKHEQELCFVGCVNVSDYLDCLVDHEYSEEVYSALGTAMQELTSWQSLYLCSLPEDTPTRDWLKTMFASAVETQQDVSPAIALPNTWEEYLSNIKRKQRHEIRRKQRRLQTVPHQYKVITEETQAEAMLPDFIRLHQASSAEKRDFWDEHHLTFFTALVPAAARAGWLKLFFLEIQGTLAATMLVFDYNNQYLLYNSGFDTAAFAELSTGNLLTAYTIEQAVKEQKSVYDFLRGDEEYKFRFGAVPKRVFDISYTRS